MDFKDFKSSCRALITSEVGSIPTRSRHRLPGGRGGRTRWAAGLLLAVTMMVGPRVVFADDGRALAHRQEPPSSASPWSTLLRSVAFPGWGQLENGQPLKAGLVFTAEAGLLVSGVVEFRRAERSREAEQRAADRGDAAAAEREYQNYLDRRDRAISRFWWTGFALLLSMLDAYADAHLRDFDPGSMPDLPAPEGGAANTLESTSASGSDPGALSAGAFLPEAVPHDPGAATPTIILDVDARRVGVAFTF